MSVQKYTQLLINAEEYDKEQVSGDQQNNTINGNDDSQKLKLKPRFEENGTQSNRFHSDILAIRQQFDLSQSLPSIDETANNNKRLPTNISRSVDELNEINQKKNDIEEKETEDKNEIDENTIKDSDKREEKRRGKGRQ